MNKNMQQYLDKAEVLIEALPYIQRFNRKIIVVKYGGSAMVDEELKKRVIEDVTLLKLVGFKPIIVHGGGKEISKWVGKVGMEPTRRRWKWQRWCLARSTKVSCSMWRNLVSARSESAEKTAGF